MTIDKIIKAEDLELKLTKNKNGHIYAVDEITYYFPQLTKEQLEWLYLQSSTNADLILTCYESKPDFFVVEKLTIGENVVELPKLPKYGSYDKPVLPKSNLEYSDFQFKQRVNAYNMAMGYFDRTSVRNKDTSVDLNKLMVDMLYFIESGKVKAQDSP